MSHTIYEDNSSSSFKGEPTNHLRYNSGFTYTERSKSCDPFVRVYVSMNFHLNSYLVNTMNNATVYHSDIQSTKS